MSIYTYSGKVLTAGKSRDARRIFSNLLVLTLVAAGAAWCDTISTVSSPSGQKANDSINWNQIGSDQIVVGASFSVQTAGNSSVGVSMPAPNSIASVVCNASPCSWTGAGFTAGDTLLWTSDTANGGTGPLGLTFGSPIWGAGAFIQSDAPGTFTANATAYNAQGTALGTASIVSSGNAVYVGLLDATAANVKAVVFSVTNCSNGCNPADFGIDSVLLTVATGPPPPAAQLSTGSLVFGNQVVNTTSASQPVTLSNPGGSTLSISNISTSANYSQSNNCGGSLGVGGSCTINVTFTPGSIGPLSGTLTITDNAPGSPQTVNLSGTGVAPQGLQFVPITPCRITDTRQNSELTAGSTRAFTIGGVCGIPTNAAAYSLNFTVVPPGPLTFITVWPSGQQQPTVSTLNSFDGRIKANAAIVPAGSGGAINVFASDATNLIIDTNGYFIAAGTPGALAFYPITPCRLVDTRGNGFGGQFGPPFVTGGTSRSFPINPASGTSNACSSTIPTNAQAYSLNFTAIPKGSSLLFITVFPTGQSQPTVSTLNDLTGTIVANAAIVPGNGTNGAVSVFASDSTDLLIDVNGYFAAPGSGGLSLYALTPCRVLDTRSNGGNPFSGTLPVSVTGSSCGVPSTAKGFVFNATVVPPGQLVFLTLWPDGQSQPVVSTLNALDGAVTSNMAIVPNSDGSTDAFVSNPTHLLLDISSYFAP